MSAGSVQRSPGRQAAPNAAPTPADDFHKPSLINHQRHTPSSTWLVRKKTIISEGHFASYRSERDESLDVSQHREIPPDLTVIDYHQLALDSYASEDEVERVDASKAEVEESKVEEPSSEIAKKEIVYNFDKNTPPLVPVLDRNEFINSNKSYFDDSLYTYKFYSTAGPFANHIKVKGLSSDQEIKVKLMDKAHQFILSYLGCPPDPDKIKSLIELILLTSQHENFKPETFFPSLKIGEQFKKGFYALIALTRNATSWQFKASVITKSSMQLLASIFNLVNSEGVFLDFKNWIFDQLSNSPERQKVVNEFIKNEKRYSQYFSGLHSKYQGRNQKIWIKFIDENYVSILEKNNPDIYSLKNEFNEFIENNILNSNILSQKNKAAYLLYVFALQGENKIFDLANRNDFKNWIYKNYPNLNRKDKDEIINIIKNNEFDFTSSTTLKTPFFKIDFSSIKKKIFDIYILNSSKVIDRIYRQNFFEESISAAAAAESKSEDGVLKLKPMNDFYLNNMNFAEDVLRNIPVGDLSSSQEIAISLFYAFNLQDPGYEENNLKQKQISFKCWLRDCCELDENQIGKISDTVFSISPDKTFPWFNSLIENAKKKNIFHEFEVSVSDSELDLSIKPNIQGEFSVSIQVKELTKVSPSNLLVASLIEKTKEINNKYLEILRKNLLNLEASKNEFCGELLKIINKNSAIEKYYLLFYGFGLIHYPYAITAEYSAKDNYKKWLLDVFKMRDYDVSSYMELPVPRSYNYSAENFGFYYLGEKISFNEAIIQLKQYSNEFINDFLSIELSRNVFDIYNSIFYKDTGSKIKFDEHIILNKKFAIKISKLLTGKSKHERAILFFYAFSLQDPGEKEERNKDREFNSWLQSYCSLSLEESKQLSSLIFRPTEAEKSIFSYYIPQLTTFLLERGNTQFSSFKVILQASFRQNVINLKNDIEKLKVMFAEQLRSSIVINKCKKEFSLKIKEEYLNKRPLTEDIYYWLFSAFSIYYYPTPLTNNLKLGFENWLKIEMELSDLYVSKLLQIPLPRIYESVNNAFGPNNDLGFYYYGEKINLVPTFSYIENEFNYIYSRLDARYITQIQYKVYNFILSIMDKCRIKVNFLPLSDAKKKVNQFQKEYQNLVQNFFHNRFRPLFPESIVTYSEDLENLFQYIDFNNDTQMKIDEIVFLSNIVRSSHAVQAQEEIGGSAGDKYILACSQFQHLKLHDNKKASKEEIDLFKNEFCSLRKALIEKYLKDENLKKFLVDLIKEQYPHFEIDGATADDICNNFITGPRVSQSLPLVDAMSYIFRNRLNESFPTEISAETLKIMQEKLGIRAEFSCFREIFIPAISHP